MIKLSISLEELILILFVGPILLAAIFNIVVFAKRNLTSVYVKYKDYFAFKKKMKEVERRKKEEGFIHEWVNVKHPSAGDMLVCKATGFCPKLYGFFEVKWVEDYLKKNKKAELVIKEREDYFEKRLYEIGQEFGLSSVVVEAVADKVLIISKEFTLQKLESLKNELKSKDF
jgi:hypothetical protein